LGIGGFQEFRQGIELVIPVSAVVLDPAGSIFHGFRSEMAAVDATVNFATEEACRFEDAKVFGDGGEGDAKRGGEFGDRGLALSEAGEDGAASGIGKGTEGRVEEGGGCGRIVNHMV
jgi:hypothetical protein